MFAPLFGVMVVIHLFVSIGWLPQVFSQGHSVRKASKAIISPAPVTRLSFRQRHILSCPAYRQSYSSTAS